jgi:hypothetical protein
MTRHLILATLKSLKIFKIKGFGNGYCFHYETGFGKGFGCGGGYRGLESNSLSGNGYICDYGDALGNGSGFDTFAGSINKDNRIMLLNITDN